MRGTSRLLRLLGVIALILNFVSFGFSHDPEVPLDVDKKIKELEKAIIELEESASLDYFKLLNQYVNNEKNVLKNPGKGNIKQKYISYENLQIKAAGHENSKDTLLTKVPRGPQRLSGESSGFTIHYQGTQLNEFQIEVKDLSYFNGYLFFLDRKSSFNSKTKITRINFVDLKTFESSIGRYTIPVFQFPVGETNGDEKLIVTEKGVRLEGKFLMDYRSLGHISRTQEILTHTMANLVSPENIAALQGNLAEVISQMDLAIEYQSESVRGKSGEKSPEVSEAVTSIRKEVKEVLEAKAKELGIYGESTKDLAALYKAISNSKLKVPKTIERFASNNSDVAAKLIERQKGLTSQRKLSNRFLQTIGRAMLPSTTSAPKIRHALGYIAGGFSLNWKKLEELSLEEQREHFKHYFSKWAVPMGTAALVGSIFPQEIAEIYYSGITGIGNILNVLWGGLGELGLFAGETFSKTLAPLGDPRTVVNQYFGSFKDAGHLAIGTLSVAGIILSWFVPAFIVDTYRGFKQIFLDEEELKDRAVKKISIIQKIINRKETINGFIAKRNKINDEYLKTVNVSSNGKKGEKARVYTEEENEEARMSVVKAEKNALSRKKTVKQKLQLRIDNEENSDLYRNILMRGVSGIEKVEANEIYISINKQVSQFFSIVKKQYRKVIPEKIKSADQYEIKTFRQALGNLFFGYQSLTETFKTFIYVYTGYFTVRSFILTKPHLLISLIMYPHLLRTSASMENGVQQPTKYNGAQTTILRKAWFSVFEKDKGKKIRKVEEKLLQIENKLHSEVMRTALEKTIQYEWSKELADSIAMDGDLKIDSPVWKRVNKRTKKYFYRTIFSLTEKTFEVFLEDFAKENNLKAPSSMSLSDYKLYLHDSIDSIYVNESRVPAYVKEGRKRVNDHRNKTYASHFDQVMEYVHVWSKMKMIDGLNPKTNRALKRILVTLDKADDPVAMARAVRYQMTKFKIDIPLEFGFLLLFTAGYTEGALDPLQNEMFSATSAFYLAKITTMFWLFNTVVGLGANPAFKLQVDATQKSSAFKNVPSKEVASKGYLHYFLNRAFANEENTWWYNHSEMWKIVYANIPATIVSHGASSYGLLGFFNVDMLLNVYLTLLMSPMLGLEAKMEIANNLAMMYDLADIPEHLRDHPIIKEYFLRKSEKRNKVFNGVFYPATNLIAQFLSNLAYGGNYRLSEIYLGGHTWSSLFDKLFTALRDASPDFVKPVPSACIEFLTKPGPG